MTLTYRVRNIVLALALAALAAALTSFYVANYKRSVQSGENSVRVFVAKRDIAPGTSGSQATSGTMLQPVKIARRSVVPGAIANPQEIRDEVATDWTYAGEQVSARRFRPVQEGGIRAELKGNLRAVQIAGDSNQLLAGTLESGDRVDVLGTFELAGDRPATRVVLRDLLVLEAPGGPAGGPEIAGGGTVSVQLAVTDTQAQKLFLTTTKSTGWTLQLRPVVDAADSAESLETLNTVLCDGMRRSYGLCTGRGR